MPPDNPVSPDSTDPLPTADPSVKTLCDKVVKRFGDSVVLQDLDLNVKRGERVTLIGRSGSGKTTILRLLMGLERVDGGTIMVDGEYFSHMERRGKLVPASERYL